MTEQKSKSEMSPDIQVRLPVNKSYFKKDLMEIAQNNGISLNTLMVDILTWFFDERKKGKVFKKVI